MCILGQLHSICIQNKCNKKAAGIKRWRFSRCFSKADRRKINRAEESVYPAHGLYVDWTISVETFSSFIITLNFCTHTHLRASCCCNVHFVRRQQALDRTNILEYSDFHMVKFWGREEFLSQKNHLHSQVACVFMFLRFQASCYA